jgi:hypothetical protein
MHISQWLSGESNSCDVLRRSRCKRLRIARSDPVIAVGRKRDVFRVGQDQTYFEPPPPVGHLSVAPLRSLIDGAQFRSGDWSGETRSVERAVASRQRIADVCMSGKAG